MKNLNVFRSIVIAAVAGLVALPVMADPATISVTPVGNGLNGTDHALEVNFPANIMGGEAVVVSTQPTNERTFNVSFYINQGTLDLCNGTNCRLFVLRTWGNREGFISDAFRVALREIPSGDIRLNMWYKDRDSPFPGDWQQVSAPFLNGGGADTKVTVEWGANTGAGTNDGFIRILKDDVLVNPATHEATNVNMPFEIDNARMGHAGGAVASGSNGSLFLDEYVSTR